MKTEIGCDVTKAKELLEEGKLVAIPTETVYGLAGNALDQKAVLEIFEVKNRPHFDPLIVHTHSLEGIAACVKEIPERALLLLWHFSPGPLTLLLPKKETLSDLVTANSPLVAVRIPSHPLVLQLLKTLPFPLAAPSANPFGYISPTTAQHVFAQLQGKIPYILDGKAAEIGLESTIIGFHDNKTILYRLGGIPVEAIEALIGKVHIQPSTAAPGHLQNHYAPRKPLLLGIKENRDRFERNQVALLSFNSFFEKYPYQAQLAPDGKMRTAAASLFHTMRLLDELPIQAILADFVPEEGLGLAINDRLFRASFKMGHSV